MAAKKTAQKDVITLPALRVRRMAVRIRGTSPLIVNCWSEKAKREIADKQQGKPRLKKAAKDPTAEYNAARYVVEGKDCIPAVGVKKALMAAAVFADLFKTTTGMSLFVIGELGGGQWIPLRFDHRRMREDTVRVGTVSKSADLRYRPEYTGWSVEFVVEFNESAISAEEVLNLVRIAGFSVGLHEWRPQKGGGDFGRFELAMEDSSPRKTRSPRRAA